MQDSFIFLYDYFGKHKYFLAILPVFFMILFLTLIPFSYQGSLKTTAYRYTGTLVNSQPQGMGTLTYTNGDMYKGHFKDGMFSSTGTFTSKSGKWVYTGTFSSGQPDGKGTLKTSDGKTHVVSYKKGVLVK